MRQLSSIAKTEILLEPLRTRSERLAFLSAYARVAGTLGVISNKKRFTLRYSSIDIKAQLTSILQSALKNAPYRLTKTAFIFDCSAADTLLNTLKIFCADTGDYAKNIHEHLIKDDTAKLAALRALFIGAGFVTLSKGYHLEFAFNNGFLALDCQNILESNAIFVKKIERGDKTIIYIKGAEMVSDTLALLGATEAMLKLSDIFAERDASRTINRRLNCDLANIDKTVTLAAKQIEAIKLLQQNNKFDNLNQKLKDAATIRLSHPEASLEELAAIVGISKSGMRHRLNKLV